MPTMPTKSGDRSVILGQLGAICRAFPEAVEIDEGSVGDPVYKVGGKIFAMQHGVADRMSLWCKAPPGVQGALVEAEAFGAPTFQVRKKNFAMLHQPESRASVWCKAPPGAQAAYVASEPDRYYAPPYLGPSGWIAAWLDGDPDWDEIEAIIDESYRLIAPKRLVAQLDAV